MLTYEGIVKNGLIQLDESVQLPENAKVYVIVTNEFVLKLDREKPIQLLSPNLVNPEDSKKFKLKTVKKEKQTSKKSNQLDPLFTKLEADIFN